MARTHDIHISSGVGEDERQLCETQHREAVGLGIYRRVSSQIDGARAEVSEHGDGGMSGVGAKVVAAESNSRVGLGGCECDVVAGRGEQCAAINLDRRVRFDFEVIAEVARTLQLHLVLRQSLASAGKLHVKDCCAAQDQVVKACQVKLDGIAIKIGRASCRERV